MGRYLVRRLLQFIPTLLIVAFLVFLIVELVPGDPCALMLGMEASGTSLDECRRDIGLELPLPVRLVDWFADALRGDLGVSLFLRQPVTEALLERFPVTISMAALAMVVALGVGVPAGIIAAINQGRTTDWAAMVFALIVLSVPSFWLALNLIFLFGVTLRWLPVGGYVPFKEDPVEFFKHLLMPCVSLGLAYSAMIARMTRTSMLEVLRMDYVRTAQAKGLRRGVVILRHAFRNALIPIATVVGMSAGGLLGGSAVTETVYTLPGVGRLVVEAVSRRDYLVVQGGILVITVTYLIMNLLVDVLYVWIDPRIRYD
jgi:peptide/nickel transport system permease protein